MYGKCGQKPVERVPATPSSDNETRDNNLLSTDKDIQSYVTFEENKLPPLRYFNIKIGDYLLAALVDSGSNRTLMSREGIKIIRMLGLTTEKVEAFKSARHTDN